MKPQSRGEDTLKSLALEYSPQSLKVLDQRALPHEERWIEITSPDQMVECIQTLAVRGAPLIGVAAALAVAQHCNTSASDEAVRSAARQLRRARPTAVNLMNCIDRLSLSTTAPLQRETIIQEAVALFHEDVALCQKMADRCRPLIQDGDSVLTHCNSGGLATVGLGTALGAILQAHLDGKKIHVYVDETRPLLQGARLTAWELKKFGVPHTLICDSMAAFLMQQGKINKIFVGADRVAKNGDFANKIGTYSLAVNAYHHKIPMYAVAPNTTFDSNCNTGNDIPIEERPSSEVTRDWADGETPVWNPAFDVTPRRLVSGVVLDDRII